jgi:hypothetical protein
VPSPDLMAVFRAQQATTEIWLVWDSTDKRTHEQWMRELAQLSMDPGSLARESEGNIWGFGADA